MIIFLTALAIAAMGQPKPPPEPAIYRLTASTYGTKRDGYLSGNKRMANGQRFDPKAHTVAVDPRRLKQGWPFGTRLLVWTTNPERRLVVTVTDTMNRRFRDAGKERIDLSRGAWDTLFPNTRPGIRQVRVQRLDQTGYTVRQKAGGWEVWE